MVYDYVAHVGHRGRIGLVRAFVVHGVSGGRYRLLVPVLLYRFVAVRGRVHLRVWSSGAGVVPFRLIWVVVRYGYGV